MFGLSKAKAAKPVDVATPGAGKKAPRVLEAKEAASKATNADTVVKTGAAKPKAAKKKGPDNNKRLAQLEAAETKRNAPAQTDDPVVLAAFEQGRTARNAAISRDDCPHGDGAAKEQWLKGYDA